MTAPNTKLRLILTIMLLSLSTLVFSVIAVVAAQNISIDNSVSVNYFATPLTLKDGISFNSTIPTDCTEIVFDLAENYSEIINDATYTRTAVDNKNLGYSAGGISLFYNSSESTKAYVLADSEIIFNKDCAEMFKNKVSLDTIAFEKVDTSNVTDMGYMFNGCTGLLSLNLSALDTSSVQHMDSMFCNCSSLTILALGKSF